jgi:ketosteroid isomerase-like protein
MRSVLAVPVLIAWVSLLAGCATTAPAPGPAASAPTAIATTSNAELVRQVAAAERAFAKTMADRDHAAFAAFVSEEAVFFSGPGPVVGRDAVAAAWKRFYERPVAPFSWEPQDVVVLASGTLALTSGPVRDPSGKHIGTFTSTWRLEAPGVWRVVFDRGDDACDCPNPPG